MTGSKATSSGTHSAKKTAGRKATAKAIAKKATLPKAPIVNAGARKKKQKPIISSGKRHQMIAEAAYFIAESQGFQNGNSEQNWLDAAATIDAMIIRN